MRVILLLLVVATSINTSCTRKSNHPNGIVSDRFKDMNFLDEEPVFMALIKLKNPALLSTAKRKPNGEIIVDESLKEDILEEQQDMEATLLSLSQDIKLVFKYRLVLNAISFQAPQALADKISQLDVNFIEADERFSLPTVVNSGRPSTSGLDLLTKNSMTFIGVDKIHEKLQVSDSQGQRIPVKGQGMRVGILDTGIDFTHAMLGGSGNKDDFESLDPNKTTGLFPTQKVVGGIDLAGENFNTQSHLFKNQVPVPDNNPVDRSGHGTHVAGTVAGNGDGVNTYDGAAPEADLFAIKVFGDKGGSTSDVVVIAALEYAADPNGDLDPEDKLDVVNLSLGGGYGKPHNLYSQAVKNLVRGGTVHCCLSWEFRTYD